MAPSVTYADNWKELRNRERLAIGLLLGYLPVLAGLAKLISYITTSENPVIAMAIAWIIIFTWASIRVTFFPCPRCGKHFYMNRYFITTFGRKCPHCGLHRYTKASR